MFLVGKPINGLQEKHDMSVADKKQSRVLIIWQLWIRYYDIKVLH